MIGTVESDRNRGVGVFMESCCGGAILHPVIHWNKKQFVGCLLEIDPRPVLLLAKDIDQKFASLIRNKSILVGFRGSPVTLEAVFLFSVASQLLVIKSSGGKERTVFVDMKRRVVTVAFA